MCVVDSKTTFIYIDEMFTIQSTLFMNSWTNIYLFDWFDLEVAQLLKLLGGLHVTSRKQQNAIKKTDSLGIGNLTHQMKTTEDQKSP